MWLHRDLSLKGRTLLSKAEGLSCLAYSATSLYVDAQTSKTVDQCLFNFLWKNKKHYIRKSVVMNSYEKGGLNFISFSTLNYTFKINWIKQHLKNPTSLWNFIPIFLIYKLGILNFLLLCNYNPDKIPSKLSHFHKQCLLSWSLIYKHNFPPHNYIILHNRDLLYKNKTIYFDNWVKNNIIKILKYEEFCHIIKSQLQQENMLLFLELSLLGLLCL